MKPSLSRSYVEWCLVLLLLAANFSCKKDYETATRSQPKASTLNPDADHSASAMTVLSQTRTANSWEPFTTNQYAQWGTQYVAVDDNSYAFTKKVLKVQRVYLILHDFDFTIPSNAVIHNITARIRRFKTGGSQVKDCFVHLLAHLDDPKLEGWRPYGVEMANPTILWPGIETEVNYSQSGSGPNGIFDPENNITMPYQWTPSMINNPSFGFYLLTNFPDKNYYYAYFDQVQITVEYSLP